MKNKTVTHKGRLSMTRRSVPFEELKADADPMTSYNMLLTLEDDSTGRVILDVTISGQEFLNALTAMHGRPCDFEFREENMKLVGKVRETMHCDIRKRKAGLVVPRKLAEDGWEHWSGYGNHHNFIIKKDVPHYKCILIRYVDKSVDSDFPDEPSLPWNDKPRKK